LQNPKDILSAGFMPALFFSLMKPQIAFLGTGLMGAPMAVNLVNAGYPVNVYNRTASKAQPVVDAGGKYFSTPAKAAQDASIIVAIVTDGPDVEEVLFGDNGALTNAEKNALVLVMSTISPQMNREMAERAAQQSIRMVDAPVSGGDIGAQNGTLSIIAGGADADIAEAMPIFAVLGKTITHCGPIGAGQVVKLCNQICGALNLLGVCEAMALGAKNQIDPEVLIRVISGGAGSSWAMQHLAPKIAKEDWSPGFMVETQQKDMRLVAEIASQTHTALPGAALTSQFWQAVEAKDCGKEGIQAVAKVLFEMANLR
jgi:3-hydroxyisobutyrate dehydrogenase